MVKSSVVRGFLFSFAVIAGCCAVSMQAIVPVQAQVISQQQESIEQAIVQAVSVAGLPNRPSVTNLVLQGNYGLASWIMGDAGGTVALVGKGDMWQVIKLGGGAPSASELSQESGIPTSIAQQLLNRLAGTAQLAQSVPSYCHREETTFLAVETKSYWVNICGGDTPGFYVGIEKSNPENIIRLPLSDYSPQGTIFTADHNGYNYILAQSAKGNVLTVSQGTHELLRETVLTDWVVRP